MKLSEIVTSLELSKKLKEIGFDQKTLFYWLMHDGDGEPECSGDIFLAFEDKKDYFIEIASAFTADELMKFIPQYAYYLLAGKHLYYQTDGGTDKSYSFSNGNIADRFSQMLIAMHAEGELKL